MKEGLGSQEEFFMEFPTHKNDFQSTGLKWEDLILIYEHHEGRKDSLERVASMLGSTLMRLDKVHSVRYRVKDGRHLIEKIIRKKVKDGRDITLENYTSEVTDLIGLRAIHLFKEDWLTIHTELMNQWEMHVKPVANHREGDNSELLNVYTSNGCELKQHPAGYRSVHYISKSQPFKEVHFCEIQVRTIFEEAWGEIDHTVRYPYETDNVVYNQFLSILNRLAGSADEMGSFIMGLKSLLANSKQELIKEKAKTKKASDEIERLKEKIKTLSNISDTDKEEIVENLDELKTAYKPYSSSYANWAKSYGVNVASNKSSRLIAEHPLSKFFKNYQGQIDEQQKIMKRLLRDLDDNEPFSNKDNPSPEKEGDQDKTEE